MGLTRDCNLLGKFTLDGIPPMPRGQPQIEVSYDVDANGILTVSAVEKSTGKNHRITIENDRGRISDEELERMLAEAEKYKAEDAAQRLRVEARNGLENYAYGVKASLDEPNVSASLNSKDKLSIETLVDETPRWIEMNVGAEKEEYDGKLKELQQAVEPLLQQASTNSGNGSNSSTHSTHSQGMPTYEANTHATEPEIDEID